MTEEQQLEQIYCDYRCLFITRTEAVVRIMALGDITERDANDILNRWPHIKR